MAYSCGRRAPEYDALVGAAKQWQQYEEFVYCSSVTLLPTTHRMQCSTLVFVQLKADGWLVGQLAAGQERQLHAAVHATTQAQFVAS